MSNRGLTLRQTGKLSSYWLENLRVRHPEDAGEGLAAARAASAIMAAAAKDPRLKKRTLTNLYNERPAWLKLAHEQLDRAVLAAYAAVDPAGGGQEDWAEVWIDTAAGQPLPADHPLSAKRAEVDQKVLANLLALNQARAKANKVQIAAGPPRKGFPGVEPK